jgi:hypothetical protein
MPVHVQLEPDAFAIVFEREGAEPETRLVHGDGERVLLHAVGLLIQKRRLHVGDRLTVRAATDEETDIS